MRDHREPPPLESFPLRNYDRANFVRCLSCVIFDATEEEEEERLHSTHFDILSFEFFVFSRSCSIFI